MRQREDGRRVMFDYGCAATHLAAAALLGLPRRSRIFLGALGAVQGALAALAAHPSAAPVLGLHAHRRIEHRLILVYFLLPWLTGVLPHGRTHLYLAVHTATRVAHAARRGTGSCGRSGQKRSRSGVSNGVLR